MTKILFPKTDNVSPKIIAPSDWESYFSFLKDYVETGLELTSKDATKLTLSIGKARLKGYVIINTEELEVTKTHGIHAYLQLIRYLGEGSDWQIVFDDKENLEDSIYLGTVQLNEDGTGFDVDSTGRVSDPFTGVAEHPEGIFGNVVVSEDQVLENGIYTGLTINEGVTCTSTSDILYLDINGTFTLNGTINCSGRSLEEDNADNLVTDAGGRSGSGGALHPNKKNGTPAAVDTINYVPSTDAAVLPMTRRRGKVGFNGGDGRTIDSISIRGHQELWIGGRGGNGGRGGGLIIIVCDDFIFNGQIISNGFNGRNGGSRGRNRGAPSHFPAGGGGGGAGGNGGQIVLIYDTKTGSGTTSVLHGNGGEGGNLGSGSDGESGGDGVEGIVAEIQRAS